MDIPTNPVTRAHALRALMNAADRLSLPVTGQQVQALAVAVAPFLAEDQAPRVLPVVPTKESSVRTWRQDVRSAPAAVSGGPSPEQLDALVAKARDRALTEAEMRALVVGVEALRRAAVGRGGVVLRHDLLQVACPKCGAGLGEECRTKERGVLCGPHLDRVRAAA